MKRLHQDGNIITFIVVIDKKTKRQESIDYDADVLIRYTPRQLQVLKDMSIVDAYHGDTSNAVDGNHGFNLCDDEQIRKSFHTDYTLDQREHILQQTLIRRTHGDSLYMADCSVVNRYLTWKRTHCIRLTTVLEVLHRHMFCHVEKTFPVGVSYRDVAIDDTYFVMWAIEVRLRKHNVARASLFVQIDERYSSWKRDPFVDAVFSYIDALRVYERDRTTGIYPMHDAVRGNVKAKKRVPTTTLYQEFREQKKHLFTDHIWTRCGAALGAAFRHIVCHGMKSCVVDKNDDDDADANKESAVIVRSVPDTYL